MRLPLLFIVYKILFNTLLKIVVGVKYLGHKKITNYEQFIIASNHNSHLDAITLMNALPARKLALTHPVAAADYFGKNKFTSFITWFFINAILIPRKRPESKKEKDPIDIMLKLLKANKSIIIFPEGSRGEPGVMQEFKHGIGIVIDTNRHTPVIPVYIDGLGRSLPKGKRLILPNLTKIYFGDAIYFNNETPEEITKIIEKAVIQLESTYGKN